MSAEAKLDRILEGDIDEVADWGVNIAEERRASALEEAAQLAFAVSSPPVLQIKALALMQAILLNPAPLDPKSAIQCVERIAKHIETTNHPEVQHTCGKVLAVLLARIETISDETFDNAVTLLRCMKRVAVFPFARDFYNAALSRGTPLNNRIRMRAQEIPVMAFVGDLAAPHKRVSKEIARMFDYPWVSFGDAVADEAKRRGIMKPSIPDLQELGQLLVEQDAKKLCQMVLDRAPGWEPGFPIVVDSIRHKRVLEELKSLVVPSEVRVLYVDVDPAIRESVLKKKFHNDEAMMIAAENAQTEQEVPELRKSAIPIFSAKAA